MDLGILGKIFDLGKYFFSSFMNIELLLIVLLSFSILGFILFGNKKIFKFVFSFLVVVFLIVVGIVYHDFVGDSFDYFIKCLMKYYYFPPIGLYLVEVVGISILFIISIFKDGWSRFIRTLIFIVSGLVYILFVQFLGYVISRGIVLTLDVSIYSNVVILEVVQISNLVIFSFVIIGGFYLLYKYFRRKFD